MLTKRAILHVVLAITLTTDFSISAQLGSAPSNDAAFHDFSDSNSNNRLKRSYLFDKSEEDLFPSNSFHENAEDDADRGDGFKDTDVNKRASSFVRIGRYPTMSRFVRIGRNPGSELNGNDEYDQDAVGSKDVSAEGYPLNSDVYEGLEDDDVNKRASSFVRIGKSSSPFSEEPGRFAEDMKRSESWSRFSRAPSSFVRIGKAPSSFVRIGKAPSSFVRIGKSLTSFSDKAGSSAEDMESLETLNRFGRAPSSFVRIGKAPSSFVRIGKAPSSFVRIGKSPSNFVRIGKAPSSFVRIGKAPSNFVRIGKAPSNFVRIGKAPSNFVRIGRGPSSFVRIGKAYSDAEDKRSRGFVRIGRSSDLHTVDLPLHYDELPSVIAEDEKVKDNRSDLLKRASSFVRIGKSQDEDKRASNFVRIGKSDHNQDDVGKRASSFVRIGKADQAKDTSTELEKRGSSFVRIGKSLHYGSFASPKTEDQILFTKSQEDGNAADREKPINLVNRGSAFVRIGKIPSSAFVRIGKNKDLIIDPAEYNRAMLGRQSAFVRIG
ncbi:unnamed protein product [Candidula unifasciata]|uniref:Uncharacterized protein n=1 Tax=Candidula unifasciata TaxID=100452 RepID=A0A8S3ZHL9_9EUPU|nr:unnamed protein product [Candidula unifasciata]